MSEITVNYTDSRGNQNDNGLQYAEYQTALASRWKFYSDYILADDCSVIPYQGMWEVLVSPPTRNRSAVNWQYKIIEISPYHE